MHQSRDEDTDTHTDILGPTKRQRLTDSGLAAPTAWVPVQPRPATLSSAQATYEPAPGQTLAQASDAGAPQGDVGHMALQGIQGLHGQVGAGVIDGRVLAMHGDREGAGTGMGAGAGPSHTHNQGSHTHIQGAHGQPHDRQLARRSPLHPSLAPAAAQPPRRATHPQHAQVPAAPAGAARPEHHPDTAHAALQMVARPGSMLAVASAAAAQAARLAGDADGAGAGTAAGTAGATGERDGSSSATGGATLGPALISGLKQRLLAHHFMACQHAARAHKGTSGASRSQARYAATRGFYSDFETITNLILWRVGSLSWHVCVCVCYAPVCSSL